VSRVDRGGLKLAKIPNILLKNWKFMLKLDLLSKFKETFEFNDTINLCYSRQTITL
jgi:hypothetical protein